MSHRKIYKEYHGNIPVDNTGRTYDIHHIDGDRSNNDIDNLVALTIEEHYNLHLNQGDTQAAAAIMMRLNKSSNEISRLNSIAAQQRVSNRNHPWLGDGSYQREQQNILKERGNYYQYSQQHKDMISNRNKDYVARGVHNFQTVDARQTVSDRNKKNIENGTHPFVNGAGAKSSCARIKDGSHHFLDKERQRELSNRARLANSIRVKRIDTSGNSVIFSSVKDAVAATPNSRYRAIQNAYESGSEYIGYKWVCLGKGISSTTISSESTDQVIGKSSALKSK